MSTICARYPSNRLYITSPFFAFARCSAISKKKPAFSFCRLKHSSYSAPCSGSHFFPSVFVLTFESETFLFTAVAYALDVPSQDAAAASLFLFSSSSMNSGGGDAVGGGQLCGDMVMEKLGFLSLSKEAIEMDEL